MYRGLALQGVAGLLLSPGSPKDAARESPASIIDAAATKTGVAATTSATSTLNIAVSPAPTAVIFKPVTSEAPFIERSEARLSVSAKCRRFIMFFFDH
jgi:hypothetical protein